MPSKEMTLELEKQIGPRGWLGVPLWGLLLVVLVGIFPSIGTFGAGLISDDGAALGYVHRSGAFSDWFNPEYDLRTIRFWRPLVTVTLGLQEATTGISPMPLRLFNLACHLAMALLAVGISRKLRVPVIGALLVGFGVALFPYQGGTVTWIVGRVDSQSVPLVLAAVFAALCGRMGFASLFTFLALATKEIGFVTLPIIVLFVIARRLGAPGPKRSPLFAEIVQLWPIAATFIATIIWRRLALGTWAGGYPGGLAAAFPEGVDGSGGITRGALTGMAKAAVLSLGWPLMLLAVAAIALLIRGFATRWAREVVQGGWLLLAGLLCCLGSTVPLATLLAEGVIPGEHERTLLLADTMLLVGLGGLILAFSKMTSVLRHLPTLALLALLGQRGYEAWQDTHDWALAGDMAEMLVVATAQSLAAEPPSHKPVLSASPPRVTPDNAYVLQWGVADRFRAPFTATSRPVWPWRPIFDGPGMIRNSVTVPRDFLRWPFGGAQRTVPMLRVTRGEEGAPKQIPVTSLALDNSLLTQPGPLLRVQGSFPGARFEALLFTELGYAIGLFGGPKQYGPMKAVPGGQEVPEPFGGVISLRELLMLQPMGDGTGGVPMWEAISLSSDFGATEAYLELRAADDGRGKTDRPVGASAWIHLTWDKSLRDAILPMDGF